MGVLAFASGVPLTAQLLPPLTSAGGWELLLASLVSCLLPVELMPCCLGHQHLAFPRGSQRGRSRLSTRKLARRNLSTSFPNAASKNMPTLARPSRSPVCFSPWGCVGTRTKPLEEFLRKCFSLYAGSYSKSGYLPVPSSLDEGYPTYINACFDLWNPEGKKPFLYLCCGKIANNLPFHHWRLIWVVFFKCVFCISHQVGNSTGIPAQAQWFPLLCIRQELRE